MARRASRGDPAPDPQDADGCQAAWAQSERRWSATVARARELPPTLLDVRVDGEWSFIQTLRHLLFVTDAWGSRALRGLPEPYHPLGLPPTGMHNPALPADVDATPSLEDVLTPRRQRLGVVRDVMLGLTDDVLAEGSVRVRGPGYPRAGVYAVSRCVRALLTEEWLHRNFAERDLDAASQQR